LAQGLSKPPAVLWWFT